MYNVYMTVEQGNLFNQTPAEKARAELTDEAAARRAEQARLASEHAARLAAQPERSPSEAAIDQGHGVDPESRANAKDAERAKVRASFAEARRKLDEARDKYPDVNL